MFYIIVIGLTLFILLILYVLSQIKNKKEEIEIQTEEYERLSQQEKKKDKQIDEYTKQITFFNLINNILALKKSHYKLSVIKKRKILDTEQLLPEYLKKHRFDTYVLFSENAIQLNSVFLKSANDITREQFEQYNDVELSKEFIDNLSNRFADKIPRQLVKIEFVILALNIEMSGEIEKQIKNPLGFKYQLFPYMESSIIISDDEIRLYISEFHCDQMAQSPINTDYRGKGYGTILLHAALDFFSDFIVRLKWNEKPSSVIVSGKLSQADKKHYKLRNKFYRTHGFELIPYNKLIKKNDIKNIIEGQFTASLQDLMSKKKENENKYIDLN